MGLLLDLDLRYGEYGTLELTSFIALIVRRVWGISYSHVID